MNVDLSSIPVPGHDVQVGKPSLSTRDAAFREVFGMLVTALAGIPGSTPGLEDGAPGEMPSVEAWSTSREMTPVDGQGASMMEALVGQSLPIQSQAVSPVQNQEQSQLLEPAQPEPRQVQPSGLPQTLSAGPVLVQGIPETVATAGSNVVHSEAGQGVILPPQAQLASPPASTPPVQVPTAEAVHTVQPQTSQGPQTSLPRAEGLPEPTVAARSDAVIQPEARPVVLTTLSQQLASPPASTPPVQVPTAEAVHTVQPQTSQGPQTSLPRAEGLPEPTVGARSDAVIQPEARPVVLTTLSQRLPSEPVRVSVPGEPDPKTAVKFEVGVQTPAKTPPAAAFSQDRQPAQDAPLQQGSAGASVLRAPDTARVHPPVVVEAREYATASEPRNTVITQPVQESITRQVVDRVLVELEQLRGQVGNVTRLELALHPPQLGKIIIRLIWQNAGLEARFYTGDQTVRNAIEQALPQLREALGRQDVNVFDLSANLGQEDGSGHLHTRQWFSRFIQNHDLSPGTDNPVAGSEPHRSSLLDRLA